MSRETIGQDEWVAQHQARLQARTGLLRLAERIYATLPLRVWLLLILALAAALPFIDSGDQVMQIAGNVLLMTVLALGLNIVAGFAGMLDLGFIAFYGVGAYTYAYLSSNFIGINGVHVSALVTIVIATLLGALVGLLLGSASMRLSGDYLAIVTLGFGLAFVNVMNGLTRVSLPGQADTVNLTGGPNGITGIDDLHILGLTISTRVGYYFILLLAVVIVLWISHNLQKSPVGRAWRSLREDELAASVMGMDVRWLKLQAFAFGAGIAAFAGAIFAARQGSIFPESFDTNLLITLYAIVVLGGLGSLPGVVIGALIMMIVPELLRLPATAGVIFYGMILVLLWTILRPRRLLWGLLLALILFGLVVQVLAGLVTVPGYAETSGLLAWWTVPPDLQGAGAIIDLIRHWLVIPEDFRIIGNYAYVATILLVMALSRVQRGWMRLALLLPTLYLAIMTWELRLSQEPSITRLIFIGLVLVILMIFRPNGILGTRRVEIV